MAWGFQFRPKNMFKGCRFKVDKVGHDHPCDAVCEPGLEYCPRHRALVEALGVDRAQRREHKDFLLRRKEQRAREAA